MIPALIKFFNIVAVSPTDTKLDAVEVNSYAMRCGYFVHPDACTPDVVVFLKSQQANFNSTFYKSWEQVDNLDELQMRILQMVHYMSTYGTDYMGKAFTLNDAPPEMHFSEFTILMPCTERQLFERIADMLESPIALKAETLSPIMEQLEDYMTRYEWKVDVDKVANRESLVRLCDMYGTLPKSPEKLLRLIVFKATGMSMIIKNRNTWYALKNNAASVAAMISGLDDGQIKGLASIFYRYKPVFLALRNGACAGDQVISDNADRAHTDKEPVNDEVLKGCVKVINRIRRLAPEYHRPMTAGVLESILDTRHSINDINAALAKESSAFKLVRILNYIKSCCNCTGLRTFVIRSGRTYIKPWMRTSYYPLAHYGRLQAIKAAVKNRLVELLSAKAKNEDGRAKTMRFPAYVELAAPVSERQFVGSVPYGSSYTLQPHNYIGIYWRNEWGAHDFDLWMVGIDGIRIGWAADHKSADILFSGDMTDANPEATEILYGRDTWPDGTVRVNRYNGNEGAMFRFFFGAENISNLKTGYMVNPDSIYFTEDMISTDRETMICTISDGKLYFASLNTGNGLLPGDSKEFSYEAAFAQKFSNYISLRQIMLDAGYKEFVPDDDDTALPDIDLEKLDKDTLIKLFS